MSSCRVRDKARLEESPNTTTKIKSKHLGRCPKDRLSDSSPPAAEMRCTSCTFFLFYFFKESVTFCLSFQVDLTRTSAAAVKAKAAAKLCAFKQQISKYLQKRLGSLHHVQRGKARHREGRWPNWEQASQPSATASPSPPLPVPWTCPWAILHL